MLESMGLCVELVAVEVRLGAVSIDLMALQVVLVVIWVGLGRPKGLDSVVL
jgi:hypothetical protein